VPIVFLGPAIAPGSYQKPAAPEDIAPTLGALLGIDYPLQDGSRLLAEMFAKGAPAASSAPGGTR